MELPACSERLQSLQAEVELVLQLVRGEAGRGDGLSGSCPCGSPLRDGQVVVPGVTVTSGTSPRRERPRLEVSIVEDVCPH